jgi:glutaminyl-peptide cyclotransferase
MSQRIYKLAFLKSVIAFAVISFLFVVCHSASEKNRATNSKLTESHPKEFILVSPSTDQVFALGEIISFQFKTLNPDFITDSIEVSIDGKKAHTERKCGLSFSSNSVFHKVGRQNIRLKIFFNHDQVQTLSTRLTILSDTEPYSLKFKVLRQMTHDTSSYTQGLVYLKGYIYEGTGQKGSSKLRKIDPADGKVIKERKLEDNFFGEGITILNNKIYQLTYLSKVGFVYDLETFDLIRKFDLQTDEGWGMTNDGQNLIMSDGSSVLYFYDPEYFTQNDQLDVCDEKGLVSKLNELEFVHGFIWANIYGKPIIVKIDSKTGKVLAQLDLRNIFPKGIPDSYDYVLNGIAYKPDSDTFYVTGKLWPVLYEIKILD